VAKGLLLDHEAVQNIKVAILVVISQSQRTCNTLLFACLHPPPPGVSPQVQDLHLQFHSVTAEQFGVHVQALRPLPCPSVCPSPPRVSPQVQDLPLHFQDETLLLPVVVEHTIDERSPLYGTTLTASAPCATGVT
jgi:hypothetical protein